MPKDVLNISDFSGGMNKYRNPRDIDDNQAANLDSFMAYTGGTLMVGGGFIRPYWFTDTSGGFREEYTHLGINNLYGI